MAKLIRKRCEEDLKPKYQTISVENYMEVVTDLVGVRVLHLFKGDWIDVDAFIRKHWDIEEDEPVIGYIRDGDKIARTEYENAGNIIPVVHKKNYRSIHYIIKSAPTKDTILCEIQTRTLFEEAWSEIDHQVRYPNFSDNEDLGFILSTFNQLAGSADEIGTFILKLTESIELTRQLEIAVDEANQARIKENHGKDAKIKALMLDLQREQNVSSSMKAKLNELQTLVQEENKVLTNTLKTDPDYVKHLGTDSLDLIDKITQAQRMQSFIMKNGINMGGVSSAQGLSKVLKEWQAVKNHLNRGNPTKNLKTTKTKTKEDK